MNTPCHNNQQSRLIENIPVPLIIFDGQAEAVAWNQPARTLITGGQQGEREDLAPVQLEFVQQDGQAILPQDHPVQRVLATGGSIDDLVVWIRCGSQGESQQVWLNARPQVDENGRVSAVYVSLRPLNSEHNVESAGQQDPLDGLWGDVVDHLSDIVVILDNDLRIVRANKAASRVLGIPGGELIGRKCYEVFQGFEHVCTCCPVSTPQRDQQSCRGIVHNHKLGKILDVFSSPVYDQKGEVGYRVHTARDVTQHIQHETERSMLSAAVEQTSEAIIITDRQANIQYVNPAFTRQTGYEKSEVLGCNPRLLQSGEQDSAFYNDMWKALSHGRVWSGRLVNRKKNGGLIHEDVTISPVCDSEGTIVQYVAVNRDITREESLENQLQQAMKMEALGTLAGGIAHDFNNILSAMIGYGQIAISRLTPGDPILDDIEQILQAGDRATDLVQQILTFSRQDSGGQFKPLKIQFIIKEVLRLLRSSFPSTIELQQMIDIECGPILADPSQIHQVLMNLCTNARQAIGEQYGVITVSLAEKKATEVHAIKDYPTVEAGRYVELSVSDTGCGMDDELLQRVFDPFFSTKSKGNGTGLGLAVVHGIVKKHRGDITVTSRVDRGTDFRVYFAVVDEKLSAEELPLVEVYRGSERVMVVDDEAVVARTMTRMLQGLGYNVSLFTSSVEAVKSYRENPRGVDLVLTDMTMPFMTGTELAREVMDMRPELPVILTTGYSESVDKKKAERIGIKELMLKPIKHEQLSQVVRRVLDNG